MQQQICAWIEKNQRSGNRNGTSWRGRECRCGAVGRSLSAVWLVGGAWVAGNRQPAPAAPASRRSGRCHFRYLLRLLRQGVSVQLDLDQRADGAGRGDIVQIVLRDPLVGLPGELARAVTCMVDAEYTPPFPTLASVVTTKG